ncbi:sulfite exporter TauE/SafE family protein 4-like [Phragmites australis]|uniref:sulfite exporter TauE/SafE family protein 4-like n=1 Tax=Phragmites australis TaxID=29695 RepID=UPI002D77CB40|nr:sulfite exporter TauE/SafE family protein 4-like [Phragmites australis]
MVMEGNTGSLYGHLNRSSTRAFLAYVAAGAACATVLACFVLSAADPPAAAHNDGELRLSSRSTRVWPDLAFNWRVVVATVVGFLGSAFGTVGGVGGGGIFVPMLNLVVGFDTKSAAALSKCMIMGASASSVWYNLQVSHPNKEAPVIDYKLALLFQPMLMLGITMGVELSIIFPYWLITVLIIILFIGTSSRSFYKGILMWREESRILMETREREEQSKASCATSDVVIDPSYEEPLLPQPQPEEKSALETFLFNLRWKNILLLLSVWSSFLVLQVLKNNSKSCSTFYWVINVLQVPVAVSVFLWEAVKLCRESRARRMNGNWECVCEASVEWSPAQLIFCAFCGLLGGTVGGLLGSGGGFILGPLLLELGCIPQVASATATFVMMFSSSLSVAEFYFLHRFPIPYAAYLICVSILAGFWGQCLVRKLVHVLKRASLIVFILSSVIFASALTMGVVGTKKSISMINNHEYMGFLDLCE